MNDQRTRPVLYCFDGSAGAARALEQASPIFADRPSFVVCVWQSVWNTVMAAPLAGFPGDLPERADEGAAARARELAGEGAQLASGAHPRAVKGTGSVWGTILEVADEVDASVIVVGSRGLSGFRSTILGSVSHGLVNHSHRPVLVVPPDEG